MNGLEQRYRSVLRLLPNHYRRTWEEDMVTTFLESNEPNDPEDSDLVAEYGRPSLPEVGSVIALAVRLRLGATGASARAQVWGSALRTVALFGFLYNAVMAVYGLGAYVWTPESMPTDWGSSIAWTLSSLVWIPAYLTLVCGWWPVAKAISAALLTAQLARFALQLSTGTGLTASGAAWLVVSVLPVLAVIAFHRDAESVALRPWLSALPIGIAVMALLSLFLVSSDLAVYVDEQTVLDAGVFTMSVAYIVTPRRARDGRNPSWSLALMIALVLALGLRLITLLEFVSANGWSWQSMMMTSVTMAGLLSVVAVVVFILELPRLREVPTDSTTPAQ